MDPARSEGGILGKVASGGMGKKIFFRRLLIEFKRQLKNPEAAWNKRRTRGSGENQILQQSVRTRYALIGWLA
jgi:hypothetical protein